jgi:hypothetical protein
MGRNILLSQSIGRISAHHQFPARTRLAVIPDTSSTMAPDAAQLRPGAQAIQICLSLADNQDGAN